MKILHKSKRTVPPPPQVAELITRLSSTADDALAETLEEIDTWKWQRSDLNAWIKVLNKFDTILEDVIREYDIDKLQVREFSPESKKLVSEILKFERLLLENSTNRKMYNSYDRLNSLLFTSDLDILILALKLLLRPSQQYSAQPAVSQALNISTPRLLSLAKRWPHLREYGIDLLDLANAQGSSEIDALPAEAREVNFSFYRTDAKSSQTRSQTNPADSSPRKAASVPVATGAIAVHLDEQTLQAKPPMQVLADAVENHGIPDSEKFDLLCRIRAAATLAKGHEAEREKLVHIRLLSIAIFGHTHPESQALSTIFLFEPDLIPHISELLHIGRGVSVHIQTAALAALDAMARYRSKVQEVLTSVNAGVNHGILMALLRKTISDISSPDCKIPHTFTEALLSFVTFIASHASGGNMIVGAGLIPLLIQVLENRLPNRLQIVSKTMQLIDNVLYSFATAFGLFCNSHGVEALVDRIEYEVDLDIREHGDQQKSRQIFGSHGELPVVRAAVLKHILRSMHRMMQSSGTSEGLRGLIDMSILRSIKKIIEYRGLFGPSVLPIAINIMATFVHNEPGSLTVIQEAGLPETFYKSIELGLEPAIEVIQAIPNAIGALCLNEVGQSQLAAHPSIIPAIFSIFTSDRHLKILLEKENAVLIGTAIDELIRHHPFLKRQVFEALKSTMTKIEELGHAYVPPDDIRHFYNLTVVPPPSSAPEEAGDKMEGVEISQPSPTETTTNPLTLAALLDPRSEEAMRLHENNIISFIDVLGRLLEGFFQHTLHCRDFITQTDGLVCLGRLTALPCLPYDFANSVASDSMVQTMRTLTEVAPADTLQQLSSLVKESLQATQEFWATESQESNLLPLLNVTEETYDNLNFYFRNLIALHVRVTLLSDVFATAGIAHGRGAIALLQTLMNSTTPQVIADLGSLHRASIWENIVFKAALVTQGIEVIKTPSSSPLDQSPSHGNVELPVQASSLPINAPNGAVENDSSTSANTSTKNSGPKGYNAVALKHLTHGLPAALSPFFQAIVKMFHARRTPEQSQKKQMMESSTTIADILLKHLLVKNEVQDKSNLYIYYSVMLGLVTVLLIDERTANHTVHTVQLLAFYRVGGIEAVLGVCRGLISSVDAIVPIAEEARTPAQAQELLHAFGGLKIVLHLLHTLISSKPLLESTQTNIVATKDKKDTDADYFEPHNFLVRLRVVILPLLRDIWQSSWLIKAPLGVCRSVIQAIFELVHGSDEAKTDSTAGPSASSFVRPNVPDESRIRQLTDMGFPRAAAEHALRRTHNNVPAATEILLANPFTLTLTPLTADADADAAPAPAGSGDTNEGSVAEDMVDLESPTPAPTAPADNIEPALAAPADNVEPALAASADNVEPSLTASADNVEPSLTAPAVNVEASPESPAGKTAEEWRKELDAAREPLRAGLSRKALSLVDEHVSLLFDVQAVFARPGDVHQAEAIQNIIDDIKTFSPYAYDVQEQPLANRCRLLALVLCETPSSLSPNLRGSLMNSLLALLLSNPVSTDPGHPTIPRWLAAHLLVTEALLTLSEEPSSISVPKEGDPMPSDPLFTGPALTDARTMIFDFCLRLLAIPDLPSDELLSTLRLFVLLTRNVEYASQFVKRDALTMLFKRLHSAPVTGSSSYIAIILRHVVEDRKTVRSIMQQSIKRYFASSRSKVMEVSSYLKNCSATALRDPSTFLEVTQAMCQLKSPYAPSHQIHLKEVPKESSEKSSKDGSDTKNVLEMQVDSADSYFDSSDSIDEVMCFLAAELMKTAKTDTDLPVTGSNDVTSVTESSSAEAASSPAKDTTLSEAKIQHQYMCFLMQCMTELLFSYDSCKVAFLSYSPKKKTGTPAKETPSNKFRAATINFLLSDLVPFESLNPPNNPDTRSKMSVSTWAMSVLVALCVDSTSAQEGKDVSSDLVAVRKFVLEAINRAIKETPAESIERQYGRLLALSDLCHRLLTVRFSSSSRKTEDVPTQISKVMLEKNFVATLTNVLSEVDLNYPNVRTLVGSILKPLEFLTKVAIKMSRAPGKGKDLLDSPKARIMSPLPSDEEDDEEEMDEVREETPDLYRNSALGMYGGEMEDMNYHGEDEDIDGDEGIADEDEEMDYDEETGSDDTSNTEEEEDVDEEMDDEEGEEEEWEDEDDEEEEDLVPDEVDEGNEDEADADPRVPVDEDDIDEAEEVIWEKQEIRHDVDPEELQEEMDDEDEAVGQGPIQIIHEEDEEERDGGSDEDFGNELDIVESGDIVRDVFQFGDAPGSGAGLFFPRRHRNSGEDPMSIFGRARGAGTTPPEATTHPLLLDASSQATRPTSTTFRGSRNAHRIMPSGTTELLQTIEELVGGGAVQLFHHIMTRGRGGAGGTETIRLDVPAGAIMDLGRHLPTRRTQVVSASVRMERNRGASSSASQTRTLEPLLTLQRWAEEVKVLHGDFVAERAAKLTNHAIITLLPQALQVEKQKKEEEAARESEREAAARAQEEREAAEQKEREEREAMERKEAEAKDKALIPEATSAESSTKSLAEAQFSSNASASHPEEDHPMEDLTPSGPSTADPDTVMADDTAALEADDGEAQSEEYADPAEAAEASGSAEQSASSRVTVMIHGNEVDITDTGIDPTFLEALPDEMREEVLNQHVRDQRAARVERPADSQISSEFLDALPPEIRAEIIQQEAMERARRSAEEAQAATGTGRAPAEIDPASFIASLDPTLRQAVLLDQDDGFIQSLPSHMIAEAGAYRSARRQPVPSRTIRPSGSSVPRKFTPQHDAIQLLDRSGVAALIRLLFFPQVLKKNLMFKVLVHLCENAKTRTELFNLLLNILQDGTGDLAAVDKSFAQMSFRNSRTPKVIGKQKSTSDLITLALPGGQAEAVPDLIAQRCLEALTYIVTANTSSSLFFLTEHEIPAGLRRAPSKKGKGKEKQMSQTHYPIVLLLGLLDRQSLLRTPSIMESVVGLLATVTRPIKEAKSHAQLQPSTSQAALSSNEPPVAAGSSASDSAPLDSNAPIVVSSANPSESHEMRPSEVPNTPVPAPAPTSAPAPAATQDSGRDMTIQAVEQQILLSNPPQIPHAVLRLIVNILTVGECSSRTFQQSLNLIQHLSYIPDTRDVIAQELKSKAQEFGHTLFTELDELANALQSSSESQLSAVASKFSAPSSNQAKLLRVLKTIDYMYSPRPSITGSDAVDDEDSEKVQGIYESFRFTSLWKRLGDCLAIIEDKPESEHVATVLLPLIESLMVVCKYVGTHMLTSNRALRTASSPRSPTTPRESMEDLFVTFTDSHRKVLNVMVRNNPSLMSGSFSLLVHNSRVLDFDNKRNYFTQQLHRKPHAREHHGTIQLNIRRARVFEDSFQQIMRKTGDQIKYGKLNIRFYEEEGVDAGGLTREWFQILARQMFDPNNALFQPCAADKLTYQPNKNSWVNPEHLSFFKFVGRVIGKAIYDGRLLDAYFARSLYRQLLGKPVDYKDVEWVDPEYYNSLCWILENDPTPLELTFSVEADEFGVNRIVPLKEGGDAISVTQENKREFVQLSAQYRLYSSIKEQIEHLSAGFYEIIPKDLITIFNEQELELLISGTPDIDVDEWRAATEYNGYTSSDPNIVWWWRALKSFNRDERAKVLSFATGTSRVPLSGFIDLQGVQGVQKFSIHRAYGESDRLPQAHTCFNQIDLPQYSSYEMLRQQLLLAINEGAEGFGFV
ncbi:hypothetical protein D9757_000601 [Collybiopsis confluens]|uniref:HECT-type E3 ubiquitin transferase n=1 Tax=Collybiopsis confluens TaxID=2823264 RepID=A0A8H5I117_9AGAR|nr:hypothetical protein D9757_000601 [Collybiopsis confluens]